MAFGGCLPPGETLEALAVEVMGTGRGRGRGLGAERGGALAALKQRRRTLISFSAYRIIRRMNEGAGVGAKKMTHAVNQTRRALPSQMVVRLKRCPTSVLLHPARPPRATSFRQPNDGWRGLNQAGRRDKRRFISGDLWHVDQHIPTKHNLLQKETLFTPLREQEEGAQTRNLEGYQYSTNQW